MLWCASSMLLYSLLRMKRLLESIFLIFFTFYLDSMVIHFFRVFHFLNFLKNCRSLSSLNCFLSASQSERVTNSTGLASSYLVTPCPESVKYSVNFFLVTV